MLTWISRILIFVFMFNVISPELLWAQQNTRSNDIAQDITRSLAQTVYKQFIQSDPTCSTAQTQTELDKCRIEQKQKLMEMYNSINPWEDPTGFYTLSNVVTSLHALQNETSSSPFHPDISNFDEKTGSQLSTFLEELAANKYEVTDLVEKIDPIEEPFNPWESVFAAEVIFNELHQIELSAQSGLVNVPYLSSLLPRLQVRVLHSLERLDTPAYVKFFNNYEKKEANFAIYRKAKSLANKTVTPCFLTNCAMELLKEKTVLPHREVSIAFFGTLRILLYEIHRLYAAINVEDPFTTRIEETQTTQTFIRPTKEMYRQYVNHVGTGLSSTFSLSGRGIEMAEPPVNVISNYEAFCNSFKRPFMEEDTIPNGWEAFQETETKRSVSKDESIFRKFMDEFMDEFKELYNESKPGDSEFALLDFHTQYAIRYALLADFPNEMSSMVEILEGKENPDDEDDVTKFDVKYKTVLQTLFATATETAKIYLLHKDAIRQLKLQLLSFAGPTYTTATRALALSSAGLLNVVDKWETKAVMDDWVSYAPDSWKTSLENSKRQELDSVANHINFSDESRQKLAAYAVDLYAAMAPRGRTFSSVTPRKRKRYGLDAYQVQELRNQLATAIDNLLPLQEPNTVWTDNGYAADPQHLITLTNMHRNQFVADNNQTIPSGTIPVFMFDSKGGIADVYLNNGIDYRQEKRDDIWKTTKIYGKILLGAAFWVYGGEILIFGVRALRMTQGAIVMMPKAVEVAKAADEGKKLAGFGKTVQQGWHYGSTNFRATHVDATIFATRTERAVRYTAESGEHIVNGQKAARTTLEGVEATEKIQAPVSRLGLDYYSPMAQDITGAEYHGANWWGRVWNGLRHGTPKIERITLVQGDRVFTLAGKELTSTISNTRSLSTADKIAVWKKFESMPGFNPNPFNYTHPEWIHPFHFSRWFNGKRGGFSNPQTVSSTMSEQRAAEILGLEGDITKESLKKAYRELALKWAPDRWMATGTEAEIAFASNKMAEINAAYAILSKGGTSGLRMSATVGMPEGFDMPLQLTRNATSPSARQVLRNNALHRGWNTFTNFAIWSGKAYWANLKFFAWWYLGDAAMAPLQEYMMHSTVEKQQQAEIDKYGDTFQPNPDDTTPNPNATNTRVNVVDEVTAAAHRPYSPQGALISTPILGTMILFGKDFTKGQVQTQLRTLSKRIDYTRALNKRSQAQNQALFDNNVNMHLEALARQRQSYQQRMAQDQGHLFTQECKAILREIDKAEATLNKLANSEDKLADKFTQFVTWAELPDLHKAENAYWLKIIDANITQMEENMLLVGDDLSKEQRYQIHQLLAQAKQKRAAKDIDGALQVIENINKTWTEEKAATAALTLEQERVLAKDDALATVALYEESYSSVIGLTPKEQRQLTKQIKALTKQARKEILNAWKQKELTLPELQIQYTDIYNNLWLQIETVLSTYVKDDKPSSEVTIKGIMEIDEDNELGIQ